MGWFGGWGRRNIINRTRIPPIEEAGGKVDGWMDAWRSGRGTNKHFVSCTISGTTEHDIGYLFGKRAGVQKNIYLHRAECGRCGGQGFCCLAIIGYIIDCFVGILSSGQGLGVDRMWVMGKWVRIHARDWRAGWRFGGLYEFGHGGLGFGGMRYPAPCSLRCLYLDVWYVWMCDTFGGGWGVGLSDSVNLQASGSVSLWGCEFADTSRSLV